MNNELNKNNKELRLKNLHNSINKIYKRRTCSDVVNYVFNLDFTDQKENSQKIYNLKKVKKDNKKEIKDNKLSKNVLKKRNPNKKTKTFSKFSDFNFKIGKENYENPKKLESFSNYFKFNI